MNTFGSRVNGADEAAVVGLGDHWPVLTRGRDEKPSGYSRLVTVSGVRVPRPCAVGTRMGRTRS